jgi:ABC-type transport system involved in cytochrome c biogenesis permease subunit
LSYVVAYDTYAIKSRKIETLTRSFWRSTEKTIPGAIFIGVWITLSFHLLIEKPVRKRFFRGG